MARTIASKRVSRTPEEHVAHADAALAAAGHQVTDPTTRALAARVARGEISGDEAVELFRRHVQG